MTRMISFINTYPDCQITTFFSNFTSSTSFGLNMMYPIHSIYLFQYNMVKLLIIMIFSVIVFVSCEKDILPLFSYGCNPYIKIDHRSIILLTVYQFFFCMTSLHYYISFRQVFTSFWVHESFREKLRLEKNSVSFSKKLQ